MLPRELQKVKSISHGDLPAHAFLWQKAFLLLPLWAVAIVPLVGFICRGLGNFGMQFGFGLVLCLSAAYFLEDLLKRKVRLDDEYIFFGFKAIPIKTINSIDVTYKKGKFLPSALTLGTQSGKRLKLNLSGLTEEGVETLFKHLQAHNSTLKTAAVLNTLVKCRTAKRKTLETSNKLEIVYHSRKEISESVDVFKSTARKWARIGPVVTCVLTGPIWMNWISWLYNCLQPVRFNQGTSSYLYKFLTQFFETLQTVLYKQLLKATESVGHFALNPIVTFITLASVGLFFFVLVRMLWRPNCLTADDVGIKLSLRLGELFVPLGEVSWKQIQTIELHKTGSSAGQMRICKQDGKKFDIDLASVSPEDRSLLLKRVEKLVPTSQIDHQLSQAMLPKSDRSYTEIWLQSLNQTPERKTLEPLEPGQLVGDERFEVLKSIGVGGQGKAYLCRNADSQESEAATVVLKETIMPVFADTGVRRKALESFEKEASLLKSLDSDGVVKLLDYFVEDHRAYLVLEHIDGCNLRELVLRDGPLTEEQVRDLALQMCEILKVLHAQSIVHRDFTPDNLILNSRGKLKLIDFNVAQQIQGGSSGTIVGKHAYLPPEQFRGKANTQSDLYALGATLFFLLTGTDPEPISQSSPLAKNAAVSEEIDRIIKQATALQTNNRYKTADEIESELLAGDLTAEAATVLTEVASHG